jgi:hypothetical protein
VRVGCIGIPRTVSVRTDVTEVLPPVDYLSVRNLKIHITYVFIAHLIAGAVVVVDSHEASVSKGITWAVVDVRNSAVRGINPGVGRGEVD